MTLATSSARVPLDRAERLLHKLCHHFAIKVAVTEADGWQHVAFPYGTCRLRAEPELLVLEAEADVETDVDALRRVEAVVGQHIELFTRKQGAVTVDWSTAS